MEVGSTDLQITSPHSHDLSERPPGQRHANRTKFLGPVNDNVEQDTEAFKEAVGTLFGLVFLAKIEQDTSCPDATPGHHATRGLLLVN